MKIYTSYFSRLSQVRKSGLLPVSIALWSPRWYDGGRFIQLAPLRFMLKEDLTNEQYIQFYKSRVLSRFTPQGLVSELKEKFGDVDLALLCYEKPNEFCHRHLVREWLNQNGIECEEFGEPKTAEPEQEQKPQAIQQTLFDI